MILKYTIWLSVTQSELSNFIICYVFIKMLEESPMSIIWNLTKRRESVSLPVYFMNFVS